MAHYTCTGPKLVSANQRIIGVSLPSHMVQGSTMGLPVLNVCVMAFRKISIYQRLNSKYRLCNIYIHLIRYIKNYFDLTLWYTLNHYYVMFSFSMYDNNEELLRNEATAHIAYICCRLGVMAWYFGGIATFAISITCYSSTMKLTQGYNRMRAVCASLLFQLKPWRDNTISA